MRKNVYTSFAALFVLMVFSLAVARSSRNPPAETVKAFYMAANEGKYSEVEKYLFSEALNLIKSELGALAGGMKSIMDKETRDGTIERIEILEEEIRGEGATVHLIIHFKDGETEETSESLIKEKGVWKITIPSLVE